MTYPHSKVIRAAEGVLANDSDFDKNDLLRVISTTPDLPTEKGGMVTLFEDGSFVYQSGPAFFSGGAPELQDGEVGVDSFTYTMSDGNGGEKTATVRFNVTGSKNPFDDEYVANKTEVLTIDAALGLFINDPFANVKIVTSPAESRQRAKVVVNPDDGSFTYDATESLSLVTDENGIAYDSFQYTAQDVNDPTQVFTATARIKVYTDPTTIVSAGSGTAFNPSIKAEVVDRVLKLQTLAASPFGGEISVQTFDVTGADSQGNPLAPKVRVAAMHTAVIPATATEPAKSITQRIVVGDFASDSFDSIDFQGNEGRDVLFISTLGTMQSPHAVVMVTIGWKRALVPLFWMEAMGTIHC